MQVYKLSTHRFRRLRLEGAAAVAPLACLYIRPA